MSGLLQDVRFALRQLRKSPGFTVTAGLMLALAICANSTVFSWIDGTMLHPIPGAQKTNELVSVMRGQWNISPSPPLSYPDYRDLREQNHSFVGILAYNHDWLTLTGGATPERVYICNVSSNFFDLLGVRPVLGRFFLPEEETRPDAVPYVVLSYALWKTRYGGDPAIVGKSIEIARHPVTVIGVAPEGFSGAMPGIREDLWADAEPHRLKRVAHDASKRNMVERAWKVAAGSKPGSGDGGPQCDHAQDHCRVSERPSGSKYHLAGSDVAVTFWRQRLYGRYAASSAGNCRGGAAIDVRQCGHAGAGTVRRSPSRDCDTAVAWARGGFSW